MGVKYKGRTFVPATEREADKEKERKNKRKKGHTMFHVSLLYKTLLVFEHGKQVYSENTHIEIGLKSPSF